MVNRFLLLVLRGPFEQQFLLRWTKRCFTIFNLWVLSPLKFTLFRFDGPKWFEALGRCLLDNYLLPRLLLLQLHQSFLLLLNSNVILIGFVLGKDLVEVLLHHRVHEVALLVEVHYVCEAHCLVKLLEIRFWRWYRSVPFHFFVP